MPTLRVRVIEAKNLNAADVNGLSDPYVVLSVGESKQKTKVIYANLNPTWNETFDIPVQGSSSILKLQVFDKDKVGSDDSLGTAEISLADLVQGLEKPIWIALTGGDCGENLLALGQQQVMKQVAGILGAKKKNKATGHSTHHTIANKGQVQITLTALDFGRVPTIPNQTQTYPQMQYPFQQGNPNYNYAPYPAPPAANSAPYPTYSTPYPTYAPQYPQAQPTYYQNPYPYPQPPAGMNSYSSGYQAPYGGYATQQTQTPSYPPPPFSSNYGFYA